MTGFRIRVHRDGTPYEFVSHDAGLLPEKFVLDMLTGIKAGLESEGFEVEVTTVSQVERSL